LFILQPESFEVQSHVSPSAKLYEQLLNKMTWLVCSCWWIGPFGRDRYSRHEFEPSATRAREVSWISAHFRCTW